MARTLVPKHVGDAPLILH